MRLWLSLRRLSHFFGIAIVVDGVLVFAAVDVAFVFVVAVVIDAIYVDVVVFGVSFVAVAVALAIA